MYAADAVVLSVGSSIFFEGEANDRKNLDLPGGQENLIHEVLKANPRTVVVLNSGGPMLMRNWRDKAPAIVQAWFSGQESGGAVADVISGKVNPSGKLPISIPRKPEDSPSAAYYWGQGDKIDYGAVGVFDGYRGYDAKETEPEFPFGHGLSFSKFRYSNLNVKVLDASAENPRARVTMTLKNESGVAGAEVPQLYVHEEDPVVPRPPRELKGFAKIRLAPGESRVVIFDLDKSAFRYWDTQSHSWKVEPGKFDVAVGSSSRDLRAKASLQLKGKSSLPTDLKACRKEITSLAQQFGKEGWFQELVEKLGGSKEAPANMADCVKELSAIRQAFTESANVSKDSVRKSAPVLEEEAPVVAEEKKSESAH